MTMSTAFKHEGFKVGEWIRAYDFQPFPGRNECFIEGRIFEVCHSGTQKHYFAHYKIQVTRDFWDGADATDGKSRVGDVAIVPMEMAILEFHNRVSLVAS